LRDRSAQATFAAEAKNEPSTTCTCSSSRASCPSCFLRSRTRPLRRRISGSSSRASISALASLIVLRQSLRRRSGGGPPPPSAPPAADAAASDVRLTSSIERRLRITGLKNASRYVVTSSS
jgi:hypothetical protein